jgi:hypothetical protein
MPNCIVGEIFPGMHCIWVPEETVASFGKQKRVIATVGKLQWHCAFNKSKTLGFYIYLNKEKLKELGVKKGSKIKVDFKPDNTELQFHLLVETQVEKIRLVITDLLGNELACRKTTNIEIENFLSSSTEKLFKGRLQLLKKGNNIEVLFKKEVALTVSITNLKLKINKRTATLLAPNQ